MSKANFGKLGPHKGLHADFLGKIKGLSAPVSADTVHYAKEWYVVYKRRNLIFLFQFLIISMQCMNGVRDK